MLYVMVDHQNLIWVALVLTIVGKVGWAYRGSWGSLEGHKLEYREGFLLEAVITLCGMGGSSS